MSAGLVKSAKAGWLSTGMAIEFLGTSSSRPTRSRNVQCIAFHHDVSGSFLFDCGDGSLRQMLQSPFCRPARIRGIFLTHLHADHCLGLPAMALCLGQLQKSNYRHSIGDAGARYTLKASERKPCYGPRGLYRMFSELTQRHLDLKEIAPAPMTESLQDFVIHETESLRIAAVPIRHTVPCFGFVIEEKAQRKIDAEQLVTEFGLAPGPLYKELLEMRPVASPKTGALIDPRAVVKEVRGRTVVILGDTCDASSIAPFASEADLLVHESTGAEADRSDVVLNGHSTGAMAGAFARKLGVRHLVITHFAPRDHLEGVRKDDQQYALRILQEARSAAGTVMVTPAHDFLAIPIPRRTGCEP